jgi:D-glycero-D-manno-heptose 1,7-bisphosphate phosphatase
MSRAIFLDRDGVLTKPVVRDGRPFPPPSVAETRIFEDVGEALARLRAAGYCLAVVSNQPDVARGTQTRDAVEEINAFLAAQLPLDCFRTCYHDEHDNCQCRKPKPGLIYEAARLLGVDPTLGIVIGDRWRDIDAGRAAGCRTVWIDRGYTETKPVNFDFRAESLREAATWILQLSP